MQPTNGFVAFTKKDLEQSMAARFEQQARKYPNHLAVKSKQVSLTYDELDRRANRVARAILARQGNADSPVAVLGKQGAAMIIASLGTLKAGKPYAPVDYKWPAMKTREILRQLSAVLILTDSDNVATVREIASGAMNVLNVEELDSQLSEDQPVVKILPDQLAYIHFTSGSTGEPKGVAASHRGELHNIAKNTNALKVSPRDRVCLLRSNNAGAARDTWLALLNGATLCPLELREEGLATLGRWLNEEAITVFTCVTTVYRQALSTLADYERLSAARLIHIGGEPVTRNDVELYKKHFDDACKFVVRYSISETPALSYFFIDKKTVIDGEHIPVGFPLEGNEISILDEYGNAVGAGEVGEIAVKSSYLAVGYWRQPELTHQKFIADPDGGKARTYLTGDLGYLRADGCLVHTGRKDFQTKIRGYRVEVGAVEAVLREHPNVEQVVVKVDGDGASDARLVAYIVPLQKPSLSARDLRSYARARLPSYMMPSTFAIVDSFPSTASGKIDRRALRRPEPARRSNKTAVVQRQSALEEFISELWRECLNTHAVDLDDDFGELGGDSLLAARIALHVNEAFPLRMPLENFSQASTVASMVQYVRAHETKPGQAEKIAAIRLRVCRMSVVEVAHTLDRQKGQRRDG